MTQTQKVGDQIFSSVGLRAFPVEGNDHPPLIKEKPRFKDVKGLERTKIWSWVPNGFENKINCAGENQE
jgi:hypothetical protein